MYIRTGDVFQSVDERRQPIFVTCCASVDKENCLIMRNGLAASCLSKFENIDKDLGRLVAHFSIPVDQSNRPWMQKYGVVFDRKRRIGAFQVKYHHKDIVDMELVRHSAYMLAAVSQAIGPVHVNCPDLGVPDNRQVLNIVRPIWYKTRINIWTTQEGHEEEEDYTPPFDVSEPISYGSIASKGTGHD